MTSLAAIAAPARFPRAEVDQSIATRFEAMAARHAGRAALRADDLVVSYGELDAHANRIAHALLDRDGGARVALLVGHGPLAPAAALGAFKAACAVVPLPAGQPAERHAAMLLDAEVGAILTDRANLAAARALAARLPLPPAIVDVEDVASHPSRHPGTVAGAHDPGFLTYTSGSTGAPKGVVQPHRNSLFGCYTYTNHAGLDAADRLSWLQSIGTIAGVTALLGGLLNGATICPFPVSQRGLDELAAWLERERITVLHTVPTLFRRLAQWLPPGRIFPHLRLVRFGGEAVTGTEVGLFRTRCLPSCRMLVGLGSSEAGNFRQSVYDWDTLPADPVVPAGDPVPEREMTLRDPDGRPVPAGAVGEMVVSSEFLFHGYWRRPELTAAVLSADPDDPRRRRFRTGDLGRFAPDGRLFHVGRTDHQVKIDGNRVELAEIEHALRGVLPVRDAAVLADRRPDGGATLTAFVAVGAAEAAAPSPRQLRAHLGAVLPPFMVPRRFEVLDELPILPGGKIDRVRLRERIAPTPAVAAPPRNPLEETVAAIWERALAVRDVGVHDDFLLDLGGDSLAAVQILADVHAVFGRALPLDVLAASRTVAAMSERLGDAGWQPVAADVLTLNADGARRPLFALCGAYGHALRLLLIAQRLGPEQPFHALQPPQMNWTRAGCRTVEAMAGHYVGEIRRRQPHGPYRLLGTSIGGVLMFEVARQLQRAGAAVELLAMVDTMPPDCLIDGGIDRAVRRDWAGSVDATERWTAAGARVAQSHRDALDAYLLRERFAGRILYFLCRDAPVPESGDRRGLWTRFATGGVEVVTVPGLHGEFHRDPQCAAVVTGLDEALTRTA